MTAAGFASDKNPVPVKNQQNINLDLNRVSVEVERLQILKIKQSFLGSLFRLDIASHKEVNYESDKLLF
jgi:flagellar basal body rod protein FlgB